MIHSIVCLADHPKLITKVNRPKLLPGSLDLCFFVLLGAGKETRVL